MGATAQAVNKAIAQRWGWVATGGMGVLSPNDKMIRGLPFDKLADISL